MIADSNSLRDFFAVYGFDYGGLGKIECVFDLKHVGEKGVSIVICFDQSLVFIDSFI